MPEPKKEEEKEQPRELLELDVHEVSLVDRAANKRQFLVVKRQTEMEDKMPNFEPDQTTSEVVEKKGKKEEEEMAEQKETEKALPMDLKDAVAKVVAWMPKAMEMEGAPKVELQRVGDFLSKLAANGYPGQGGYPSPKPMRKDEDKVQKAAVVVFEDGTVMVGGEHVQKSRKRFTDNRVASLKESIAKLVGLLKEIDEEAVKGISQAAEQVEDEEKKNVKKNAEDVKAIIQDTLKPVTDAINQVQERIERIEKTRSPSSTSSEGDKTDTTTVEKGKGSIWDNLL